MDHGLQTRVNWILRSPKTSKASFDRRCDNLASLFCEIASARFSYGLNSGLAASEAKEEALESIRSYALQVRHCYAPPKMGVFELIESYIDEAARGAALRNRARGLAVADADVREPAEEPTPRIDAAPKEERAAALNAYKAEGKKRNVKITDKMVSKAAWNGWNDRTPVARWKQCHQLSTPLDDRRIRAVLKNKPHLK